MAKASNVDTAFDDGIERLLNMAKNQKLKEKKVLRLTKDIFNYKLWLIEEFFKAKIYLR